MTPEGGAAGPPGGAGRRGAGGGCATAFGLALILFGGFALWVNLAGADALVVLLSLAPLLAVWWPAALVLWGIGKVAQRLATGRSRTGAGEVVLLLAVVFLGLALTGGRRLLEGLGLEARFGEVRHWVAEQAEPLPQHAFVRELRVALPAEGPASLEIELPAGGVIVEAVPPPPGGAEATAEGGGEAEASEGGGAAPPREAAVRLGIRVRAADRARAEARAERIRLVETRPGGHRDSDRDGDRGGDQGVVRIGIEDEGGTEAAFDLTVEAPPGIGVSAATDRGAVRIRGAFARVSAETGGGPVAVEGARAEVSIVGRDGPVRAEGLGGALTVRARRAPLTVEEVAGAVSVESSRAPMWISSVAGPVTVRADGGAVEVSGAGGAVEVDARLAPVSLVGVEGRAEVSVEYGGVFVVGVAGALDVRAESGRVEARGIGGGARITAGAKPVLLADAAGEVFVQSAGEADLDVRLAGGSATGGATGGSATGESATGEPAFGGPAFGGPVTLTTGGGDVWLELPPAGAFALSAEVAGAVGAGEVESDEALGEVSRVGEGGAARWTGLLGTEGAGDPAPVSVRTGGGDLTIRAAGPER